MYSFNSQIGLMIIKFDSNTRRFNLIINNIVYGSYISKVAAADDVYTFTTGCHEWDLLDSTVLDVPSGITEWKIIVEK